MTDNYMIVILGLRACKLVWMFLLSNYSISSCCSWSSWKFGWSYNWVCLLWLDLCSLNGHYFLYSFDQTFLSKGLLKLEKHSCPLLTKSYLLVRLVWVRWYDHSLHNWMDLIIISRAIVVDLSGCCRCSPKQTQMSIFI